MIRFLNADDFLRHAISHRIVFLGGNYGTGKSSLSVALSYLLLSSGLADYCVSSMPVAWAIPAAVCPPSNFVALLDELGVEFDARSFADKGQNKARRSIVAFMRKLNAFAIVSSKVTPDITFRPLVVQRAFSLAPIVPLDIYSYGLEEGKMAAMGHFGLWHRDWLWKVDAYNPCPKYGNEYVPTENASQEIVTLFDRAISEARKKADLPDINAFWGLQSTFAAFAQFYRVECEPTAYSVLRPASANIEAPVSGANNSAQESGQSIHVGIIAEKSNSAGFGFSS